MIPVLERRLSERRNYRIPPNGFISTLEQEYENLQVADPSEARESPTYLPRQKLLTFSDMCIRGPGGQTALAKKWRLSLPQDYFAFCKTYSEYVFAGRTPFRLLGADEIYSENGIREAWDVPNAAPRRLFYFARVVDVAAHFAFRWNKDFNKLDIVFSWDYGDIGEPILLGRDADRFVSDQDFTSWLSRLLQTDGHPVFPGKRIPMASGWMKQDRPGLIRI